MIAPTPPRDYAPGADAAGEVSEPARKPLWNSRTLWLNAIAAGLLALEAGAGLLQPLLPVDVYAAVAIALPVLNAMLRVVTTQGLRL